VAAPALSSGQIPEAPQGLRKLVSYSLFGHNLIAIQILFAPVRLKSLICSTHGALRARRGRSIRRPGCGIRRHTGGSGGAKCFERSLTIWPRVNAGETCARVLRRKLQGVTSENSDAVCCDGSRWKGDFSHVANTVSIGWPDLTDNRIRTGGSSIVRDHPGSAAGGRIVTRVPDEYDS
jgi:hypothetical protein